MRCVSFKRACFLWFLVKIVSLTPTFLCFSIRSDELSNLDNILGENGGSFQFGQLSLSFTALFVCLKEVFFRLLLV